MTREESLLWFAIGKLSNEPGTAGAREQIFVKSVLIKRGSMLKVEVVLGEAATANI
jgi:hypothetical protein